MTSPAKRKGSQFERAVVAYLQEHGFPYAERAYGAGRPDDQGDVDGVVGWCLELKAHARLDLAGWCAEAEREATNGRRRWWAVVAKRRQRPVEESYVILPLRLFAELLADEEP